MSEDELAHQAGDEAMARRLKALACTAPLHQLDTRKTRLDWLDGAEYQMAEIALQAIDQVTIAMDFDRGADQEQVVRRLLGFIAAQCPGRAEAEYAQVGNWVLENLINVGSLDRGFRAVYGALGAGGRYERRHFDFKLLVELAGPDGEVYLRATDEAINVLVGALDTDVESAQIAAEVKLENLIKRGRLGDARLAAEQARYRTVQYAETLRRQLDATRRDVRSVDWLATVPELIEEALTHIETRYRAENAIMTNIADARDEATDNDRRRRAAELVGIVSDCVRRHTPVAGPAAGGRGDVSRRAGPPAVRRCPPAGHDRPVRPADDPVPEPGHRHRERTDLDVLHCGRRAAVAQRSEPGRAGGDSPAAPQRSGSARRTDPRAGPGAVAGHRSVHRRAVAPG